MQKNETSTMTFRDFDGDGQKEDNVDDGQKEDIIDDDADGGEGIHVMNV